MSRLPYTIERDIKSKVEQTTCPQHEEHPQVTFTTTGINVSCCCENFREETISKCSKIMGEAINQYIFGPLKG